MVLHRTVWYELGGSMVFQEAMRQMEKQRNRQHVIWCITTNTRANRIAIVRVVITNIFNPLANIGWSQFNLQLCMFSESVYSYLLPVPCYCLSVVWLSFISVLFLFGCFCSIILCSIIRSLSVIFCPNIGIVFQVFRSPYQQTCGKSINIIHQTMPSLVLV